MRHCRTLHIICLLVSVLVVQLPPATAFTQGSDLDSGELEVRLASGRAFRGQPANTTDTLRLVLHSDQSGVRVTRAMSWSRIVELRLGSVPITREAVLGWLDAQRTSKASDRGAPAAGVDWSGRGSPVSSAQLSGLRTAEPLPSLGLGSLEAVARWSTWSPHEEGLELRVMLRDRAGEICRARGYLTAELFALRSTDFAASPRAAGSRIERLGSWSFDLDESDFGAGGAVVRLPYQNPAMFARVVGPYGRIHVRWVAPGQEAIDLMVEGVRLQNFRFLTPRIVP